MLKLVTRLTLLGVNLPKWPVQPKSACGKNFQKLFFSHVHAVTSNLVLQCTATIIILCIGETHNLINYVSFINYLSYGVTIAGLLYYRWKKPNLYRPIKVNPAGFYHLLTVHICNSSDFTDFPSCTCCLLQVNLLVPVCYLMFWAVLLGFSLYSEPVVCGVGLVIMLTGVPVYFLGVHWKEKPKCIYNFIGEFLKKLLCKV